LTLKEREDINEGYLFLVAKHASFSIEISDLEEELCGIDISYLEYKLKIANKNKGE